MSLIGDLERRRLSIPRRFLVSSVRNANWLLNRGRRRKRDSYEFRVGSSEQKRIVFCSEIADNIPMKKILVVEDEEGLRLLYQEELEAEGYEVITARNGQEAIQQLETGKPDLILLDIVMPVMDGREALGRMGGKGGRIPIILNTSYSGYQQ